MSVLERKARSIYCAYTSRGRPSAAFDWLNGYLYQYHYVYTHRFIERVYATHDNICVHMLAACAMRVGGTETSHKYQHPVSLRLELKTKAHKSTFPISHVGNGSRAWVAHNARGLDHVFVRASIRGAASLSFARSTSLSEVGLWRVQHHGWHAGVHGSLHRLSSPNLTHCGRITARGCGTLASARDQAATVVMVVDGPSRTRFHQPGAGAPPPVTRPQHAAAKALLGGGVHFFARLGQANWWKPTALIKVP